MPSAPQFLARLSSFYLWLEPPGHCPEIHDKVWFLVGRHSVIMAYPVIELNSCHQRIRKRRYLNFSHIPALNQK